MLQYRCTRVLRGRGGAVAETHWRPRRSAALLEVVLSLSLLLVAMSVVGLTFRNGERSVGIADQTTRGMLLTERLLSEMDTGILTMEEREQSGWFGEEGVPGMSWRVEINPHEEIKGLLDIDISIFMGDPDGTADEHELVLWTRVQRPEPKGIDFEKDFGMDQDQIAMLSEAIPGGQAVFDPTNFDPRSLAQLDLDNITDLLPALMQLFGGSLGGNSQLDGLIKAAQEGDLSGIQNLAQQAVNQGGTGATSGGQSAGQGGSSSGTGTGQGSRGAGGGTRPGGTRQGLRERSGGGRQ